MAFEQLKDKSVFIGSSTEGLDVAEAVKRQFAAISGVDIWNERVFELNRGNLDSLVKMVNIYDFAILCMTADNETVMRGEQQLTPGTNLFFELGLCMGRMGLDRTHMIVENSVTMPTDFAGVSQATFDRPEIDGDLDAAVRNACSRVGEAMVNALRQNALSYYPATALAAGYYQNFIKKIRESLMAKEQVILKKSKEDSGQVIDYEDYEIHVIIPERISDVDREGNLQKTVADYSWVILQTPTREYPFYLKSSFQPGKDAKLVIYDFPTTLVSSKLCIDLIFKGDVKGTTEDVFKMEIREIRNFMKTLNYYTHTFQDVFIDKPERFPSFDEVGGREFPDDLI